MGCFILGVPGGEVHDCTMRHAHVGKALVSSENFLKGQPLIQSPQGLPSDLAQEKAFYLERNRKRNLIRNLE